MPIVKFRSEKFFRKKAQKTFEAEKKKILESLPLAKIEHVGSTVIRSSLTKGDLDIQVRVTKKYFRKAKKVLAGLYEYNNGNPATPTFASFKKGRVLGVQLTAIGSKDDNFHILRDILVTSSNYRKEYNLLKKKFEGKSMKEYRKAKARFFEEIKKTAKFKRLKALSSKL